MGWPSQGQGAQLEVPWSQQWRLPRSVPWACPSRPRSVVWVETRPNKVQAWQLGARLWVGAGSERRRELKPGRCLWPGPIREAAGSALGPTGGLASPAHPPQEPVTRPRLGVKSHLGQRKVCRQRRTGAGVGGSVDGRRDATPTVVLSIAQLDPTEPSTF